MILVVRLCFDCLVTLGRVLRNGLPGAGSARSADTVDGQWQPHCRSLYQAPIGCLTLSKTRAHFGIRSTSKNIWNEIIRYLRSWLQSVSRIRSFHCQRMHSESESQFTCAAPVKSALP